MLEPVQACSTSLREPVYEVVFIEFLAQARVGAPAIASIGGAGTFDGIVLSGLVAALLA